MKTKLILLLTLVLAALARSQVLPNDAMVEGKTIPEWGVEFEQWLFVFPRAQNPSFDTDGSRATNSQPDGPVFFLPWIFDSGPRGMVTRTFTIPEDKFIFVPLGLGAYDNVDVEPPYTVQELLDFVAGSLDALVEQHASIDGVSVPNLFDHRVTLPPFGVNFTNPDNLFSWFYGHPYTGLDDPIASDGYALMIRPLPVGRHVINYGVTFIPPNYTTDVTDIITVVAIPLSHRIQDLISTVEGSSLPRHRKHELLSELREAAKDFERNHAHSGIEEVQEFQKKVRHEISRTDPALATQLIDAAQKIIAKAKAQLK